MALRPNASTFVDAVDLNWNQNVFHFYMEYINETNMVVLYCNWSGFNFLSTLFIKWQNPVVPFFVKTAYIGCIRYVTQYFLS